MAWYWIFPIRQVLGMWWGPGVWVTEADGWAYIIIKFIGWKNPKNSKKNPKISGKFPQVLEIAENGKYTVGILSKTFISWKNLKKFQKISENSHNTQ